MMKHPLLLIVIITGYVSIAVLPIYSQSTDSSSHWLLADANPDGRSQADFAAFADLLKVRGKVPSDQIHHIEGDECTQGGLHKAIRNLVAGMKYGERLIFFYRGEVTKPRRTNSIYLLTHGADSTKLAAAVQDIQLNRWFRETGVKHVTVLFDGYTNDPNIYAYLANRELLGAAALISIKSSKKDEDALLRTVLSALNTDESDLDDNRKITIGELHEYLVTETPPQESIVVPTGNVETPVLKLPAMLKINTTPEGASVSVNGQDIGVTPHRMIDNLKRGNYEIRVNKQGYLIPPTRSTEVGMSQGEAVEVSWVLNPITVYGEITPPKGKVLEQIAVWIEDTSYRQTIGMDGKYRFGDWNADDLLLVGSTYALKAEAAEIYYAETSFIFQGHDAIERNLTLAEKTWFEVAQERFNRQDNEGAIAAFQNGIEISSEFPPLSPELTVLLFNSFSAAVDSMDIENIAYLVATARLSDRFGDKESSKRYWNRVRSQASKGTAEYDLASKRLRELDFTKYIINWALIVLLVVVLISGGYTARRYFRRKESRK